MRWRSTPLLLLLLALQIAPSASEVQVGDEELGSPTTATSHSSPENAAHRLADAQLIRVLLYGNSIEPLACGGVQIAREVVLTSATCLQTHGRVTSVSSSRAGSLRSVIKAIVHPRFEQSNDTQFDVAILIAPRSANETATAAAAWQTVVLDSRGVTGSEPFDRLQLGGDDAELEAGVALPYAPCASRQNQTDAAAASSSDQAARCIQTPSEQRVPSDALAVTNAALLRHSTSAMKTSYLVGLQADTSRTDFIVSVPDIANFVNAYSTGHSWGASPGTSTALSSSKAPWTSELVASSIGSGSSQYVVALRAEKNAQKFCGGTLIAPTFVLTTANCVSDGLANYAAIGSDTPSSDVEVIRIAKNRTVIHPSFGRPYIASFDAAIIELEFAAYAQPISLSTLADFTDGTHATMTSPAASIDIPVWSKRTCEATVPGLDSSTLCAGGEAGQDACAGDAGSPLAIVGSDGKEQLIGIVSAGYGCGRPEVPGLYTRVAALAEFVQTHTVATQASSSLVPESAKNEQTSSTPVNAEVAEGSSGGARETTLTTTVKSLTLPSLTPVARDKVIEFLLQGPAGTGANIQLDEILKKFMQSSSVVELHSSGDLSALLAVMAEHNALPLNQRKDRFGSFSVERDRVEPVCGV